MAYTKYSLTPASNTAAPPDGAPEGMLPSAVNDTMRDMMSQIRDCGDGIRGGTYTMTAPIITGGSIDGATVGATTATTGRFTTVQSTVTTGTAPFTVASTTNVANLNASSLNGATFAAPGAIGGTTAAAGNFTTVAASSTVTGTALIPSSSSVPSNGVYLPAANSVGIATNSTLALNINANGLITTPKNPAFTAQINANTDATFNSGSNISFNVTGYNRGSNFNTSTYAFTAPVAGLYFFTASLYLSNSSSFTGNYQYGFVVNGSFIAYGGPDSVGVVNGSPNANGGTLELTCTWLINLSANDTVAVQPRSASLRVYQGHCYFSGCLIG